MIFNIFADYHNSLSKNKIYGSTLPSSNQTIIAKPKQERKLINEGQKSASESPAPNLRMMNLNSLIIQLNQNHKRNDAAYRSSLNSLKNQVTEAIYHAPVPNIKFPQIGGKSHRSLSPKPFKKVISDTTTSYILKSFIKIYHWELTFDIQSDKEEINLSKDGLKEIKELVSVKDLKDTQANKNIEKIKNIYISNPTTLKNPLTNSLYNNVASKYKNVQQPQLKGRISLQ